jgi:hypothetical protein
MESESLKTECPCVDCITLGICKAAVSDGDSMYWTLAPKCSLFMEYYTFNLSDLRRQTLVELFAHL